MDEKGWKTAARRSASNRRAGESLPPSAPLQAETAVDVDLKIDIVALADSQGWAQSIWVRLQVYMPEVFRALTDKEKGKGLDAQGVFDYLSGMNAFYELGAGNYTSLNNRLVNRLPGLRLKAPFGAHQ